MVRKFLRVLALVAVAIVAGCGSSTQPSSEPAAFTLGAKPMARCVLVKQVGAYCGTLRVAENPNQPSGRQVDLRVVVIPARSAPVASDPVFFISGGPGGAATEDWAAAPAIFPGIHLHHEIVLVDQRGTGASHKLELPPPLPGENLTDYARRVVPLIDGDPPYYTTTVAMDDLDAVRLALGYSKIDLYGGSYGATAVQYYLRQHADHVRAAVLDGGSLLDVLIMELVAANSQRALDAVLDRCLADLSCQTAFPNVRSELATVFKQLDRAPVTSDVIDQATGKPVIVTHELLASVIHAKLLTAADAATIPWLIHRTAVGSFHEVAASSTGPGVPSLVMSIEIRCAEAWARFDSDQIRHKGAGSYYLSAQLSSAGMQATACPLLPKGVVPSNDAQPVVTSVPVLLLNGTADPQDPPTNVAAASVDMPNSLSVAVPGQGHTVGHLYCLPTVVADFITAAKPNAEAAHRCAETVPVPPFQLS